MKKLYILFLMSISLFVATSAYASRHKEITQASVKVIEKSELIDDVDFNLTSPYAILIETSTNSIIYEKNSTEARPPASMTKIMTMILVMEAIACEKIKLEDKLVASENASKMGGTTIYLETGEEMSVEDLLKGLAITSANDAAVVFAEAIGGSVDKFVQMMNEKARELECVNTNFVNPNGLPATNHYSCAYDMAIMSSYLVNNYPLILQYTNIYEDYLRKGTDKEFWLVNTNKLVRFYEEVDGLKTGWTSESGYCLSATSKKNEIRFVAVVMGAESSSKRNSEIMTMLNYGASTYELTNVAIEGEIVDTVSSIDYKPNTFNIIVSKNMNYLIKKGNNIKEVSKEIIAYESIENNIYGEMKIYIDDKYYDTVQLITDENVSKASYFNIFKELIRRMYL